MRPSTEGLLDTDDSIDIDEDSSAEMGVSLSTARLITPASIVFNVLCQIYGMVSSPNMKEIADANHAMFSPQPMFIGAFFVPQVCIQLLWVYDMFKGKPNRDTTKYVPYFVVGEVAIGFWMIFWNSERFVASHACVMVNSLAQLYAVSQLSPIRQGNILTHAVAKMMAGIGIMDLLDNGAVAFFPNAKPNLLIMAATAIGFTVSSFYADYIMGASLIFDLVALHYGQSGTWRSVLGGSAVATSVGVLAGNLLFPRSV